MSIEVLEPIAKPLTPKEAQVALGVGQTTLFKLIKTGDIRSFKVGKSRRIPREEITRYIQENSH